MKARHVTVVLLGLVATTACQRTIPVADVAGGAEPISELVGVQLGMRAHDLVALRSRAVAAPYYGFRESPGQDSV